MRRIAAGCGVSVLIAVLLAVFAARTMLSRKPDVVRTEVASRGTVEVTVIETGAVQPVRKVEVKSKAGGRVLRLFVDEGARVRRGQILATIDPQEVNSQVAALRAQLSAAEARVGAAERGADYQKAQTASSISQYVQNAESARAHAAEAETQSSVQPKLTAQTIGIAEANLDAARAALDAQRQSLLLMQQSTHPNAAAAAQAAWDQARAQAENDRRNVNRQKQLLDRGFVAASTAEAAATTAAVSEAHLRETRERLDSIRQANLLEEKNAQAQIASAASQVRQMQAALDQARSSPLNRTRAQELEGATAAYRQALAQLNSARSGITQDAARRFDAAASAADAQQIKNQLRETLVKQGDTTLYAAMDGVITRRYVEEGELIESAVSSFSSGSPVYQISDLHTLIVKLNINEVDVPKLRRGQLTEVELDADRGAKLTGVVRKISPTSATDTPTGQGNTASTSGQTVIKFPVEIQINGEAANARPGMSARCTIVINRKSDVLRIPRGCVEGEGARAKVWVEAPGTAAGGQKFVARDVVAGLRGEDFVEIISGLRAGEHVKAIPFHGPARKTIPVND